MDSVLNATHALIIMLSSYNPFITNLFSLWNQFRLLNKREKHKNNWNPLNVAKVSITKVKKKRKQGACVNAVTKQINISIVHWRKSRLFLLKFSSHFFFLCHFRFHNFFVFVKLMTINMKILLTQLTVEMWLVLTFTPALDVIDFICY